MANDDLLKSDKLSLSPDRVNGWLYADWVGRQSPGDIRRGGEAMIRAMGVVARRDGLVRILNDNRRVIGSWSHSIEWAATSWLPRMVDAGLRRFAWVLSPDAFAKLSSVGMTLIAGAHETSAIKTFDDLEAAKRWLRRPTKEETSGS